MNTITCKQLGKYKDKSGKIIGYRLVDQAGAQTQMKSEELKARVKAGNLNVVNLTLTKDGRLIDSKEHRDSNVKLNRGTPNSVGSVKAMLEKMQNRELKEIRDYIDSRIKRGHRHSAFGVQIDFDIPDFIKINEKDKDVIRAIENDTPIHCWSRDIFIADQFKLTRNQLQNHQIKIKYYTKDDQLEEVEDTVQCLVVLYCMANNLVGLTPSSTKSDVEMMISLCDNIYKLIQRFPVLAIDYFKLNRFNNPYSLIYNLGGH